jgi:hypothetical protein
MNWRGCERKLSWPLRLAGLRKMILLKEMLQGGESNQESPGSEKGILTSRPQVSIPIQLLADQIKKNTV